MSDPSTTPSGGTAVGKAVRKLAEWALGLLIVLSALTYSANYWGCVPSTLHGPATQPSPTTSAQSEQAFLAELRVLDPGMSGVDDSTNLAVGTSFCRDFVNHSLNEVTSAAYNATNGRISTQYLSAVWSAAVDNLCPHLRGKWEQQIRR